MRRGRGARQQLRPPPVFLPPPIPHLSARPSSVLTTATATAITCIAEPMRGPQLHPAFSEAALYADPVFVPPRVLTPSTPLRGRRLDIDLGPSFEHESEDEQSHQTEHSDQAKPPARLPVAADTSRPPPPRSCHATLAACAGRAVPAASWPALDKIPPPATHQEVAHPAADDAESDTGSDVSRSRRKRSLLDRVPVLFPPHSPMPEQAAALVPTDVPDVGRILAPPATAPSPSAGACVAPGADEMTCAAHLSHIASASASATEQMLEYPLSLTLRPSRGAPAHPAIMCFPSSARLSALPNAGPIMYWPRESAPESDRSRSQREARLFNISDWLAGSDDETASSACTRSSSRIPDVKRTSVASDTEDGPSVDMMQDDGHESKSTDATVSVAAASSRLRLILLLTQWLHMCSLAVHVTWLVQSAAEARTRYNHQPRQGLDRGASFSRIRLQ